MKLKLPILFNTDSTQNLQDADIDFDLRECEVKTMIFYQINCIAPYFENGIEYCQVYSNGMSFYTTLKINEVESLMSMFNVKFELQ